MNTSLLHRLMHIALALFCICFTLPVSAQQEGGNLLQRAADFLDGMARRSIDTTYIEVPEQPWRVMSTTKAKEMAIRLGTVYKGKEFGDEWAEYVLPDEKLLFTTTVSTGVRMSTGINIGYRTIGLGYAVGFGKKAGTNFSFSTNGNRYGININLRRFKTDDATMRLADIGAKDKSEEFDITSKVKLDDACKIKSLMIDAYYVFNHRRFSNAATHRMAFIQRRSAGSFIADLSWVQANADYASFDNAAMIDLLRGVGRINMRQINIGLGYSYNWVPLRGLTVNASLTPRLSLDNRLTIWRYTFDEEQETMQLTDKISRVSRWKLTAKARAAVVYNHKRWFAGINAEIQRFRYHHLKSTGRLKDWSANAVIGLRF